MMLLTAVGGGGAPSPWVPPAFPLVPTSQIVVDGNSISANHGLVPTLAELLSTRLPVQCASTAISGQTWQGMLADHADVDAAWDDQATNHALVVNETTNSIRTGRSVADTKQDITDYFEAVRSAHPWVIVAWSALPVGHADEGAYPGEIVKNAGIVEINDWMSANRKALGIDTWLDARAIPQYGHDGSNPAAFEAYQAGWQEVPPSALWEMFGWLHPTTGAWPTTGNAGVGKAALAGMIASAFESGQVPAVPLA